MKIQLSDIKKATAEALIKASTSYSPEHKKAYEQAIELETEPNAKWLLQMILENAITAEEKKLPLCDDTGIPYILLEIGDSSEIEDNIAKVFEAINQGIIDGLSELPGRPMAVKGDDIERIAQIKGLFEESEMVLPSPVRVTAIKGNKVKITVLMLGGGPEIRAKTYRVFHHHNTDTFINEIAGWAVEMAGQLGCTPCIPSIGIGRTHYEATCLMMDAMAYGEFGVENELEKSITKAVNDSFTGTLGIGGNVTAIQSFVRVGQQRASGVRIVCLRLGCIVDPRRSTVVLG